MSYKKVGGSIARTGRPKIQINKEEFEKLCQLQCTEVDIANFYNCSVDTVNNWCKKTYGMTFSDAYKIKSASGRISLRRWQFARAEAGSDRMLIWLGKQHLGQTEKVEATNTHEVEDLIALADLLK